MSINNLSTASSQTSTAIGSTTSLATPVNLANEDPNLVGSLLDNIVSNVEADGSGSQSDAKLQQLAETIQAYLASNGVNITDEQALMTLAQGIASGVLSNEALKSIIDLNQSIPALPAEQQQATLNDMLDQINGYLTTTLSAKDLSQGQITALKELVDEVANLQTQQNQLATLTEPAAVVGATPKAVMRTLAASGTSGASQGSSASVLPYLPITSLAGTLTAANIVQGNMDVIMQAIIIMFSYISNVQTEAMHNYENNYVTISNNVTAVTAMQKEMLEITQYMANNTSNISSLPGGVINVFYALDIMRNPSGAIADGIALGILPSGATALPAVYTGFIKNCPNFMNALSGAYNQYAAVNVDGSGAFNGESFQALAAGDTGVNTGQAQIMTFLTEPVNGAGYTISGLGSQAIFSQEWTNNRGTGSSGLFPTPSGYLDASGNAIKPTVTLGAQLSFSPSGVANYVGSGGTGQSSGTGVLGVIGTTITNGSTNSNQVQSLMAACTQSISGIWQLIGQHFIPADKFV
jgi:hypothetical protein